MKTLHLAIDDKFMPFAQRVFETAFPNQNQFRVMRRTGGGKFIQPSSSVQFVSRGYWFSSKLRDDLQWADCVIIHFMTKWSARAARMAPSNVLVVWHGWGADYYQLLDKYSNQLHLPMTKALLDSRHSSTAGLVQCLTTASKWAQGLGLRVLFPDWQRKTLPRLDVISMMPEEFEILTHTQKSVHARHHQLYCFSAEESFVPGPAAMEGPDILLGNSASPTNNHLETFEVLRGLDLEDRNLIVPLSYGDHWYAAQVCTRGKKLFGNRFVPLLDYLPAVEYAERLASCGFVFMNHVRQQATGNVSTALLKGAKVFLRRENLLTSFYRKLGAHIDELPETSSLADSSRIFMPLSPQEQESNRRVIMEYWAMDTIIGQARRLSELAAP